MRVICIAAATLLAACSYKALPKASATPPRSGDAELDRLCDELRVVLLDVSRLSLRLADEDELAFGGKPFASLEERQQAERELAGLEAIAANLIEERGDRSCPLSPMEQMFRR